jgi:hypothetical protein
MLHVVHLLFEFSGEKARRALTVIITDEVGHLPTRFSDL